MKIKTNL